MDDQVRLGFEFARDFGEQLITLSTGIVALSVSFTKDLVKRIPPRAIGWLGLSWLLYVTSIVFGLMHLMALTGQLAPTMPQELTGIGRLPRSVALGQVLAFLGGTVSVVVYGFIGLRYWRAEQLKS